MALPARSKLFGHQALAFKGLVGAAAAVLAVSVSTSPAYAETQPTLQPVQQVPYWMNDIDPGTLATMRMQSALEPAAKILTEAAMKEADNGLAGLAFEDGGLAMYWKGSLTPGMTTAMARARQFGKIVVRSATYSRRELEAAAAKIDAVAKTGSEIQAIKLKYDGSGLIIERVPAVISADAKTTLGQPLPTAAAIVQSVSVKVPVELTTADSVDQLMSCPASGCERTDDTSPWNSGDYLYLPDAGIGPSKCTSGFGVNVPSRGATYVLTAAHCMTWHAGGGDNAYDGAGELIGRASFVEDWDRDLILIEARGWYFMFDGGPASSYKKTVHSWGYPVVNELLCQSGATSGVVCGLKTESGDYSNYGQDSDGDWFTIHGLTSAVQIDGQTAARHGDSGAPVFSLDGNGVRAKGSLTSGSGSHMRFQDMGDITTSRSGPGSSAWLAAIPLTS